MYENPVIEITFKPKEDGYTNTPISPSQSTMSDQFFLETTQKKIEEQSNIPPIAATQGVVQSTSAQPGTDVSEAASTTLQTSGTLYKTNFDITIHWMIYIAL